MDRIDALRIFLETTDLLSFSAVARSRTIATSTVALAISQLEKETSAKLITRSTRKMSITPEGERFRNIAREIVRTWDDSVDQLSDYVEPKGPIRITASNDFGRNRLRPLLDRFQDKYPGTVVSLLLNDSNCDLVTEKIDLAIRNGPLPDSSLRARLLVKGPRIVCASPAYWKKHKKPKHPKELSFYNCLVLARPGEPISTWSFNKGDVRFAIKVQGDRLTSDGEVVRQWALEGRGVAFKNVWDIKEDLKEGRLESALEGFTANHSDLFAMYQNGGMTNRLSALISFLAIELKM